MYARYSPQIMGTKATNTYTIILIYYNNIHISYLCICNTGIFVYMVQYLTTQHI